jgi:purine nucleosidase
MARRKIIIDTDPGQDDTAAIMLAFASKDELEVVGLTVVSGNVPINQTVANTLTVCELCGERDAKVYPGASNPLIRPAVTATQSHGKSGIEGPELPAPSFAAQDQQALEFLREALTLEAEGELTVCCLGPLTNIARLILEAPETAKRMREIVLMGGSYAAGGNVSPAAEFNIHTDPEAADIVFRSGIPIVMMPLDVTYQLVANKERQEKLFSVSNRCSTALAEMIAFSTPHYKRKYGFEGRPLHDPTTVAYLLKPELFTGRSCNVVVETKSDVSVGMTVVDWLNTTDRRKNAYVMRSVNVDGFFELLFARLAKLP